MHRDGVRLKLFTFCFVVYDHVGFALRWCYLKCLALWMVGWLDVAGTEAYEGSSIAKVELRFLSECIRQMKQ